MAYKKEQDINNIISDQDDNKTGMNEDKMNKLIKKYSPN